jgi:hypothetical protein
MLQDLFLYTRTDGVQGLGFQVAILPTVIHHCVIWPDKTSERYNQTMLDNQQIVWEGVDVQVSPLAVTGETLDPMASTSSEESTPTPDSSIPSTTSDSPSVLIDSQTGTINSTSTLDAIQSSSETSETVSETTAIHQALDAVTFTPESTDERKVQRLLLNVSEASNTDIIQAANRRGLQVTEEFVVAQRAEVDRLRNSL